MQSPTRERQERGHGLLIALSSPATQAGRPRAGGGRDDDNISGEGGQAARGMTSRGCRRMDNWSTASLFVVVYPHYGCYTRCKSPAPGPAQPLPCAARVALVMINRSPLVPHQAWSAPVTTLPGPSSCRWDRLIAVIREGPGRAHAQGGKVRVRASSGRGRTTDDLWGKYEARLDEVYYYYYYCETADSGRAY